MSSTGLEKYHQLPYRETTVWLLLKLDDTAGLQCKADSHLAGLALALPVTLVTTLRRNRHEQELHRVGEEHCDRVIFSTGYEAAPDAFHHSEVSVSS